MRVPAARAAGARETLSPPSMVKAQACSAPAMRLIRLMRLTEAIEGLIDCRVAELTPGEIAESGAAAATVQVASAESLPFPDASFDVVISNGALNLMPDKLAVFREVHRVLRPGSRFQFADVVRVQATSDEPADPDEWAR